MHQDDGQEIAQAQISNSEHIVQQEAIQDLGEYIENLYMGMKEAGEKGLGPDMLKIWNYMKLIFKENKNAVKTRTSKKHL